MLRYAATRFWLVAALLLCLAGQAFAQNSQRMVPVDSEIYQIIKSLYISQGLALPSTTGPWTEAELRLMLGRVNAGQLRGSEQQAYDYASEKLKPSVSLFQFHFTPTVELHAHTDTDNFVTPDYYIRHPNLMRPMLAFSTEAWFFSGIYVLGALDVGTSVWNATISDPNRNGEQYPGSTLFGNTAFSTNIWLMPPSTMDDLEWITPVRSFVVLGGDNWYFSIGRDRLSWGPGESGNFMVGDQVDFHNNIRLSVFNQALKYTFNVSAFEYPGEYYTGTEWDPDPVPGRVVHVTEGVNLFIAHRFEFRALQDKLNFAVTEAIMYQHADGLITPQVFLPTLIMHNLYRKEEMNSLLTLEADYTPIPLLNIYAQFAVDEFTMPGDAVPSATKGGTPPALAYMLGVQTAFPLAGRLFSASFEFALTDPYLYLRGKDNFYYLTTGQGTGEAGINYVVANRATFPVLYYEEFLGYRWGGDAIVLNAHAGYREIGVWNVEANLMFMIHGTYDKWTTFSMLYGEGAASNLPTGNTAPTESHPQDNHADSQANLRDAPYYLTAFSVLGSWNFWRNAELYGQVDIVGIINPGNRKANAPIMDLQLTLGISYKL
jgi:hypothetical protein